MKMITSNGKQPYEMLYEELKRERRLQKWWANWIHRLHMREKWQLANALEKYNADERKEKSRRAIEHKEQNVVFLEILENATRLFVDEIEDAMLYKKKRPKHYKVTYYKNQYATYKDPRGAEHKRIEQRRNLLKKYETLLNRSGVVIQWDKRKLMLIAKDRGYMTEIATCYAIEQELEMPKYAIKRLIDTGKFTWGQVLVIGALFEMTPKEFCDTFLSGYFVEQGGDWRASYDNIDKDGLLAHVEEKKTWWRK